jgi:hypothetical protein
MRVSHDCNVAGPSRLGVLADLHIDMNLAQFFFLILSPRMQQSVRGHSAAMLAGNDSDMQGIHPVMYLL